MQILDLNLTELNTWVDFDWLNSVGNFSLESHTLMESLRISFNFNLELDTEDKKNLSKNGKMTINMKKPDFRLLLALVVNISRSSELKTAQLVDPACLLGTIEGAKISKGNWKISRNYFSKCKSKK
jgi:hypothetical protein